MTQHMHKCLVDYLEIGCAQGYVMCLHWKQELDTGFPMAINQGFTLPLTSSKWG